MTAKEAKEKSNKVYFEMQEKNLNNKIKITNNAIKIVVLKGYYNINIWFDLDFNSYLKFRKYYKNLGYKVSFPQRRGISGYYIVISWR